MTITESTKNTSSTMAVSSNVFTAVQDNPTRLAYLPTPAEERKFIVLLGHHAILVNAENTIEAVRKATDHFLPILGSNAINKMKIVAQTITTDLTEG